MGNLSGILGALLFATNCVGCRWGTPLLTVFRTEQGRASIEGLIAPRMSRSYFRECFGLNPILAYARANPPKRL